MIKRAKDAVLELPLIVAQFRIDDLADAITADRLRVVELVREMSNEYPDVDAAVDIADRLEKEIREAGK